MEASSTTSLWQLGAQQLADAIRSKEASSREVVQAHLDRIAAVNPSVNALHVTLADEALAGAEAADRALAAGGTIGPLHGVPVSVKENVDVAGTATTWGLAPMAEAVSPSDAPVVANLRAAGAIPISRGNLPDLALRWHTDNDLMGATINPWDPSVTPGGSSAGEAVALATGMAPLAVGNDIGGSLRWPSQCSGTAALRPSQGRVPDASVIPPTDGPPVMQLFNSQGPMARQVVDLRIAFEAMIAPSPRDPWYTWAPLSGPALGTPAVGVAIPGGTEADIALGVTRAAAALAERGYAVSELMPPELEQAATLWGELINEDVRRFWPAVEPATSQGARDFVATVLGLTEELEVHEYAMRWQARQVLARLWSLHQAQTPLILAPICLRAPFAPGEDLRGPEAVAAIVDSMRFVVAVNILGLPSAVVPVGHDDRGMPLAVQIIGPRFREDLCLDTAAVVEDALGTITPIDPRMP